MRDSIDECCFGSAPPVGNAMTKLLYVTREPCPTFRADVAVLFGKYLPRTGLFSDLVAQQAPGAANPRWGGGRALLAATRHGRVAKSLGAFVHSVLIALRAERASYDAIQVRDMPFLAIALLLVARSKRLSFFYWMSFPIPEDYVILAHERARTSGWLRFVVPWLRGRVGRFLLYRVVLPRADHVFVQTEIMRQNVAAHGIPREKMTAVPMAVDVEAARPECIAPSDDARLAGRRVLVYLGNMTRGRRIDVLLDMLGLVREEVPDVVLVLVGEPESTYGTWLLRRAEELAIADALVWTGWLPVHEGWRYVRAAEVGLSPIPRSPLLDCGSPTKTLEYLALGVPVVGNDNPDQSEILEKGGGGYCVPLNARDFAQAVCMLLADEKLRRRMARSGQRYVEQCRSYAVLGDQLATRYMALLGRRGVTLKPD